MNFIKHYYIFGILLCAIPKLVSSKGQVTNLNEDSWTKMLDGEWMVEFFAPWCPACIQLQPVWKEFAEWSDDLSIKVGDVDVTQNPGLSGRFMITALPTIFHVKDGVFRQYRGSRDKDSFISFVEDKKWQKVEPVSSWYSPQSMSMTIMSCFFKFSMLLRNVHNTMVQDYGIPYWGSYIVFGLATILIGALLGLIIVCSIDYFCPSRGGYDQLQRIPDFDTKHKEKESDGEYEGEDVIKDDTIGDGEVRKRRDPDGRESED